MIFAEFVALIAILTGGGIGVAAFKGWMHDAKIKHAAERQRAAQRQEDLRAALSSNDYRKLDDFVIVWASELDSRVLEYIRQRRDELYIEENSK